MPIQIAISVGKVEPTFNLAKQTNIKSQGSPYDHFMLCLPQTISNILFATLNQVLLLIIL